jgi:uncharacterized protein YabN with tetrapyrrole methylase and pyrophosphatase domain
VHPAVSELKKRKIKYVRLVIISMKKAAVLKLFIMASSTLSGGCAKKDVVYAVPGVLW